MDFKKAKGREIALFGRIAKKRGYWLVSSQTRPGIKYKVNIENKKPTCTCADFATNGRRCKHIHGVIHRVEYPKTNLVDVPDTPSIKRKTYKQDWPSYNRAQTEEKDWVLRLLAGLCETVQCAEEKGPGRPRLPLSDASFLSCYKVFERTSSRRFMSDVGAAHRAGFISCVPHFNSIINAMNDPRMTAVLLDFIKATSLPFRGYDQTFAPDSSGFTSLKYDRWVDLKNSKQRQEHTWTKVHLMCGTDTHVVTAVVIKDKNASDSKQLPELLDRTMQNFKVTQVCADGAYASLSNYEVFAERGVKPYIPFNSNHSGAGKGRSGNEHKKPGGKLWQKMYHAFQYHREEFLLHYHQRSNVETVFSMIKAKFGNEVRSRNETAALNEVLCKIVCHNICRLVSAMFEHGLDLESLMPARPRVPNLRVIAGGKDAAAPSEAPWS